MSLRKHKLGKYFPHHSPIERENPSPKLLVWNVKCGAPQENLSHVIPELLWPLWQRRSPSGWCAACECVSLCDEYRSISGSVNVVPAASGNISLPLVDHYRRSSSHLSSLSSSQSPRWLSALLLSLSLLCVTDAIFSRRLIKKIKTNVPSN